VAAVPIASQCRIKKKPFLYIISFLKQAYFQKEAREDVFLLLTF
jgi:hypothetical protein